MKFTGTKNYVSTEDLSMAVNATIALERPLIIKGEPGTGNVAEAIYHIKKVNEELRAIKSIYDSDDKQDLVRMARDFKVSYDLVEETAKIGRLPVVNFAAGGIATPADAAYLMSLGCDGIFVGSGIFKAEDAQERAHGRQGLHQLLPRRARHVTQPTTRSDLDASLQEARRRVALYALRLRTGQG